MSHTAKQALAYESTTGSFNYLDGSVQPSLYRNGAVYTTRDADGCDSGTVGMTLEAVELSVSNARALRAEARPTCDANGFELLDAPIEDERIDFFDHEQIVRRYYGQCTALVMQHTGGRAYAFDHNIRSATGQRSQKRITGGQPVQKPIHLVHGDYTLTSAPARLRDLTRPPSGNDTFLSVLPSGGSLIDAADAKRALSGGRFAMINVWRSIADAPVAVHPLALCDGRSVEPSDLVVFEIHYQDRIGENYFARHSPAHRWYYYPKMTREEALLIKQWDSAGTLARSEGASSDGSAVDAPCTFSFHSAFDDPASPPDAPDRWSIEVRCMVLYD